METMSQASWSSPIQPSLSVSSVQSEPVLRPRKESDELHPSEPESGMNPIIPVNPDGKRYSMRQIFQVWYDNEELLLNTTIATGKQREPFKATKPALIYHLELQNTADDAAEPDELEQGVAQLSVDERKIMPPPNLPPPTTTPAGGPKLVLPTDLQWVYLDPSGNEQGPFSGDVMQDWLTEGYLTVDLRIRRREETSFYTLNEFCERLQNFSHPFKVALPEVETDLESVPSGSTSQVGSTTSVNLGPASTAIGASTSIGASTAIGTGNATAAGAAAGSAGMASAATGATSGINGNMGFNQTFSPLYSQLLPKGGLGGGVRSSSSHLFDFMSPDYLGNQQYPPYQQFVDPNMSFGQLNMPFQAMPPPLSRTSSGWGMDLLNGLNGGINGINTLNPGLGASLNTGLSSGLSNTGLNNMATNLGNNANGLGNNLANNLGNNLGSNLANNLGTNALGNPSLSSSALGNNGLGTPLATHSSMAISLSMQSIGQPMMPQPMPMSPWLTGVQSVSRVNSPFTTLAGKPDQDVVLNDIHNSMVTGILDDRSQDVHEGEILEPVPVQKAPELEHVPEPAVEPAAPNEPVKSIAPVEPAKPESPVSVPGPASVVESESEVDEEPLPQVKLHKLVEASQPVLAPWAVTSPSAPGPSLKEIQQLEAERLQKERQLRAEMRNEALAAAVVADKSEKITFNWANTQPAVAQKSLAEIQKEEADARAWATKAAASKPSLASSLANAVPKDDFSWTTVSSKKPAPKKSAPMLTQPTANLTPQMLRAASSPMVMTNSHSNNTLKEDFMVWARSSMTNLYPLVSKDDLLEVFTTLPMHGDSAQLIAETMYSSSATMDGRRFAQEFMKRRQQVERQLGADSGLWSAAIAASADKIPAVDDEGWTTSSKPKKKGKRI